MTEPETMEIPKDHVGYVVHESQRVVFVNGQRETDAIDHLRSVLDEFDPGSRRRILGYLVDLYREEDTT